MIIVPITQTFPNIRYLDPGGEGGVWLPPQRVGGLLLRLGVSVLDEYTTNQKHQTINPAPNTLLPPTNQDARFRVDEYGVGFGVSGAGIRVYGSGFRV